MHLTQAYFLTSLSKVGMKLLYHGSTHSDLSVYISGQVLQGLLVVSDLVDACRCIMVREINQRQEDGHPTTTFFNVLVPIPVFLLGKLENQVNKKQALKQSNYIS